MKIKNQTFFGFGGIEVAFKEEINPSNDKQRRILQWNETVNVSKK